MKETPSPSADRLRRIVGSFRGRRLLVLADLVADEFLYGRVQRVSREAPVLILQYDGTDIRLGGGANAVHNIRTLGGTPIPVFTSVITKNRPRNRRNASRDPAPTPSTKLIAVALPETRNS